MQKFLMLLFVFILALSFVACGKGGDAGDKKDDGKDKEEVVKAADTVENLFKLLDKAIKKGDEAAVKGLYDATSVAKLKAADPALVGETVHGTLQNEIKVRGQNKGAIKIDKKTETTATVKLPSGKILEVQLKKVDKLYKIDVLKSAGGEMLEM